MLGVDIFKAKNFLIWSSRFYGFEHLGAVYVHPDAMLANIRRMAKKQIEAFLKSSQKALSPPTHL